MIRAAIFISFLCLALPGSYGAESDATRLGGGLCVMPKVTSAEAVLAVLGSGSWRVHALADPAQVPALREALWQAGVLGRTAWVDARGADAPWVEDSVELFLLPEADAATLAAYPADLVGRLLVPTAGEARIGGLPAGQLDAWAASAKGCAVTRDAGGLTLRRNALPGADSWTHWYHDAGNNPVSRDTLAGSPQTLQWLGLPQRGASYRAVLAAQGVLVSLAGSDHIYFPSEAEDACRLSARSLGNGTPLWQRPLRQAVTIQPICAIGGGSLYLADGANVVELDLRGGREQRRFTPPGTGGGEVCAVMVDDRRIYALAGPEVEKPRGSPSSRKPLPIPAGRVLAAWDRADGRELWRVTGKDIDPRSLALGGARLHYHDHGDALVAADVSTGRECWRLAEAENMPAAENGLYTFLRPVRTGDRTPYVVANDTTTVVAAPGVDRILAIDGATGAVRYRLDRAAGDGALRAILIEDGQLLLAGKKDAGWLDLVTGKPAAKPHAAALADGCARPTISAALSLSKTGAIGDRTTGDKLSDGASRSGCEPGGSGIFAGGLSVVSPQGYCTCATVLPGGWVVRRAAARDRFHAGAKAAGPGPEPGPQPVAARAGIPGAGDWPQARHDGAGSAGSRVKLGGLNPAWKVPGVGAERSTPPIAVAGLILVADDRGLVRALAEADGKERWHTLLGGAVLRAPTVADGRLLIGSADGLIACLDPITGALAWRLRVPPMDRRVMLYGRWSSTWPVHSGVVVHAGKVYAAAGMVPDDGVWLVAANLSDGKVFYRQHIEIPGATVAGDLHWQGEHLWLAAGNQAGLLRIDPATGAAAPALNAGKNTRQPFGGDLLGYAPDLLLVGGRYLHAPPTTEADHRKSDRPSGPHHQIFALDAKDTILPPSKEREFGRENGFLAPVWDEELTVWCDAPFRSLTAAATPVLRAALSRNQGAFASEAVVNTWSESIQAESRRRPVRTGTGPDLWALALAADALVCIRDADGPWVNANPNSITIADGKPQLPPAADRWELLRINRADGRVQARQPLSGRPRLDGLCLSGRGAVAVVLADGGVALYR